jgi:hypothetical protein
MDLTWNGHVPEKRGQSIARVDELAEEIAGDLEHALALIASARSSADQRSENGGPG